MPPLPAIPEFHLPQWLQRLHQRLPQWPHAIPLCCALNLGLRLKALPADLRALCEGKTIRLVLEDGGSEARIVCRNGCFHPDWKAAGEADVTFRGELHAYLKLLTRQEDPDTLFFNRQIAIEGDTELGLGIKNLLDALDWPPPFLEKLNAPFERLFGRGQTCAQHGAGSSKNSN
ncbi:MAG: SCP2 sterol-binding domain-containing protein [Zoogloeaceae bacterium]|jgi:predicted lipid carrier protein YhbT|nr:SCP2 sterol-binding domain-containing protein [Zoogloeaceae bacterium]